MRQAVCWIECLLSFEGEIQKLPSEDVKSYIEQMATREIPDEIERYRLPCEHYYREINLFVAALLGLTTLDNIAQMGVQEPQWQKAHQNS